MKIKTSKHRQLVENLVKAICNIYESEEEKDVDSTAANTDTEQEQKKPAQTVDEARSGVHAEFDALYKETIAKMQSGELPGDGTEELEEAGYDDAIAKLIKKNGGWCDMPLDIFKGSVFDGPDKQNENIMIYVRFPDKSVYAFAAAAKGTNNVATNSGEKSSIDEIINKIKSDGKNGGVFISLSTLPDDYSAEALDELIADSEYNEELYAFGGCWQVEFKFADNVLQFRQLGDGFYNDHPNFIWNPVILGITYSEYVPSIKNAGKNGTHYLEEDSYDLDEGDKITDENGLVEVLDATEAVKNMFT